MADEMESGAIPGGGDTASRADTTNKDASFDRGALEAKVSGSLAALRASEIGGSEDEVETVDEVVDESEAPAEEVDEQPETSEPEAESDDSAEATDEETEVKDEDEEEQSPKPQAKPVAKKGPTLPAHLRRTLKAYEWSDEDIDSAFAANPAGFTLTAQKMHNTRSQETAQWAAIGRAARPQKDEAQVQSKQEAPSHVDPKTGLYQMPDIDGLIEEFGNEELVRKVTGPFVSAMQELNTILPELRSGMNSIHQSRVEAAARQIDTFFQSESMKQFTSIYGTESAKLTDKQMEKRNELLELADALIAGARSQGKRLTNDEAMLIAHDSVGREFKAEAIRKDIKTKVQQRSKSISLKPTRKGQGGGHAGPARNRAELEARVKTGLAQIFNR